MSSALSGLYAITDPNLIPSGEESLCSSVREALLGGARIIQYRNKIASVDQQRKEARLIKSLTQEFGALLFINDSIELCLAANADGVHLGQKDDKISSAKQQLGSKLLGVTCHNSIELAEVAIGNGADYCAFGAIFPSTTKPQAQPCSLATLQQASKLPVPICAIGGITADNGKQVIRHGADMLAVISGVFGQPSIQANARALASLF